MPLDELPDQAFLPGKPRYTDAVVCERGNLSLSGVLFLNSLGIGMLGRDGRHRGLGRKGFAIESLS